MNFSFPARSRNNAAKASHLRIGEESERLAQSFLEKKGLELVEKNYRCRYGEIDLIMRNKQCLVFIEVRYRKTNLYGNAAQSITPSKIKKITHTAHHFLNEQSSYAHLSKRFDFVGITGEQLEWIENAF